jgi:hypothetical protein
MNYIEKLLGNYPSIINFLGVSATIGAVVVALWLGIRNTRPQIKSYVNLSQKITPDKNGAVHSQNNKPIISLTIINTGIVPLYLTCFCFGWRLPFFRLNKQSMMQIPEVMFNELIIQQGQTKTLEFGEIEKSINGIKELLVHNKKCPSFLLRYVRFFIYCNGRTYYAKIDPKLLERIIKTSKKITIS